MRTFVSLVVVVLSWTWPAFAQPQAAAPTDTAVPVTETADSAPTGETAAPADSPTAPVQAPTEPADAPAGPLATPAEPAATSTAVGEPPPPTVPAGLPGACPAPAARTIEDRLARSDEGDAAADLDLAACWRLLEQPYPEAVALDRALARGLDEQAAAATRQRLADLGGVPVPDDEGVDDAGDDLAALDVAVDDDGDDDALAAYVLAGVAGAGLITGTAFGLATLHESSRAERELAGDTLELEYGIATGVCLGLGLAAGIAALVLWPDARTGPAPGPGDVGLGWEVWW